MPQEPRNYVRDKACINIEHITTIWTGWKIGYKDSYCQQLTILLNLLNELSSFLPLNVCLLSNCPKCLFGSKKRSDLKGLNSPRYSRGFGSFKSLRCSCSQINSKDSFSVNKIKTQTLLKFVHWSCQNSWPSSTRHEGMTTWQPGNTKPPKSRSFPLLVHGHISRPIFQNFVQNFKK